MSDLTIEQIESILNSAPKDATHFMLPDIKVPTIYLKTTPLEDFYWNMSNSDGVWHKALDRQIGAMQSLSDLRNQLTLIEENEKLKAQVDKLESENSWVEIDDCTEQGWYWVAIDNPDKFGYTYEASYLGTKFHTSSRWPVVLAKKIIPPN